MIHPKKLQNLQSCKKRSKVSTRSKVKGFYGMYNTCFSQFFQSSLLRMVDWFGGLVWNLRVLYLPQWQSCWDLWFTIPRLRFTIPRLRFQWFHVQDFLSYFLRPCPKLFRRNNDNKREFTDRTGHEWTVDVLGSYGDPPWPALGRRQSRTRAVFGYMRVWEIFCFQSLSPSDSLQSAQKLD
jgi:hypothetical protein